MPSKDFAVYNLNVKNCVSSVYKYMYVIYVYVKKCAGSFV